MITLQQLLMSDSDLSGGTQTGKGADGAQDFLSLLAGALSDATGKGKDAPLTLADLKAAGSKLSKVAQDAKGDTTLQAKIADLLSRQPALNGDETSPVTSLDTLVSGLVPLSKGDALKTLNAANGKDDGKSDLSEEELAGLSALMAMLPHQQQTTASRVAGNESVSATSTLNSATLSQNGAGQLSLNAPPGSHDITLFTKQGQQTAELRLHPEDLGQVQISLKLDDNQAQLQMVSSHSHVRAALEAALPVLRTSLAENGIQLAQSSVSSESFAGQQQSSSQQHQASRSGNNGGFTEESDELLPVPAALQSAARGNSAVDIFA